MINNDRLADADDASISNGKTQPLAGRPSIYTDGSYLEKTSGLWHIPDAPLKARWIAEMLARHANCAPSSICDIGCGAGAVLHELSHILSEDVSLTGYDISPQACALQEQYRSPRLAFSRDDAFSDGRVFDLALIIDVVEHIEDCFLFLRQCKRKARMKLYHIPLDVNVNSVLRGINGFDNFGHLHAFTVETALKSLEYTDHRVIEWVFTEVWIASKMRRRHKRLGDLLRQGVQKISVGAAARLLGGYSMLILAE